MFPLILSKRLVEGMVIGEDKPHSTKVASLSFEAATMAKKTRKN